MLARCLAGAPREQRLAVSQAGVKRRFCPPADAIDGVHLQAIEDAQLPAMTLRRRGR
jgi:hypothetical protein